MASDCYPLLPCYCSNKFHQCCCHAIATINFINVNAEDFIPICFRRSTYEEIYRSIIFPVNGEVLWERTPYPDVHPPHKRILSGDPRKKEGWKSGSWERITHKSTKEVIEKNVAYAVRLDITGTIAQISLWMSRLQHLLRLHQMSKLLRMHQLLKLKQLNHQGMKWRVKQHHYQHQKNHLNSLGWNYRLGGGHDSNYKRLSYFLEFLM